MTTAAGQGSQREFAIDADYPESLLGSGLAPSPNELFLAALECSFMTSFVLAAAATDVRIEYMRIIATQRVSNGSSADDDVALSPGDLELHCEVGADTSRAHLERLLAIATKRSPVVAVCRSNVRAVLERAQRPNVSTTERVDDEPKGLHRGTGT